MRHLQTTKVVQLIGPVSSSDPTENYADTLGFSNALIIVNLGAVGSSGISACAVHQSDASGSGYALITGANFDGGTDIEGSTASLPAAANDDEVWAFDIDLLGKKRYLKLIMDSASNVSLMSAVCVLGRADVGPGNSNSERTAANVGGAGVVVSV